MIFSLDEVAELVRAPRDVMVSVIAHGDPEAVGTAYEAIERLFRSNRRGFQRWESGTVRYLSRERPYDSFAEDAWSVGAFNHVTSEDVAAGESRSRAEFESLTRQGDAEAASALFDRLEASFRRLHDAHTDLVARLWSVVYEREGAQGLFQVQSDLWERSLAIWMEEDLTLTPRERLPKWTATLHSNFARFKVEELPNSFRITQAPCGTCVRRLEAGAYGPPLDLAVVPDALGCAPEGTAVPIYRTHVAAMHNLLPTVRIGHPWPLIACPAGVGTGPCVIELEHEAAG